MANPFRTAPTLPAKPARPTVPAKPARPALPAEPPSVPVAGPPEHWPALPPPPPDSPSPTRAWAAVVSSWLGTIIATVAVFGPWAHYADGTNKTGVEHGDGWIVLFVALVAAGLTGAIAFGARQRAVRIGVVATSGAMFVLYAVNRIDIARSKDRVTNAHISVGGGLFAVALAGCFLLAGALLMPSVTRADETADPHAAA
ncbi:MAG TPA: hypothetical protein VGQ20_18280 [Acidimicrobiales bacterium]|jgi:hypothetical protein|nr:hypothetical protein [Acidimicrobiales bacterium]